VSERFDAIVIGLGPGGEVAAARLLDAGQHIAVVERELIGGECAYWACIPSKTLLRVTEARGAAGRTAGLSEPDVDWPALRDYRDYMVRHHDDAAQIDGYRQRGATVLKGTARLDGPGKVVVGDEILLADEVILATGSAPVRPPIEGLETAEVWTNRDATNLTEIPDRVTVIGGGAVGVELGQFLARMGSRVSILEHFEHLIPREHFRVGELAREALQADGIEVRTGVDVVRVARSGSSTAVEVSDGPRIEADVILLATGRRPHTAGLGLEAAGAHVDERGAVLIDEHCRAADRLWAIGDVTGVSLFTHVAMYQGRVVAANLCGSPRVARYEGIPRVVFCDPEVAAVGLSPRHARADGIEIATQEVDLADSIARPWTYEKEPTGTLGVVADLRRRVLVGAWAVAPLAGEWIHQAALAIRAKIPLEVLVDQVAQFPTYSEAFLAALEPLDR
jgi:pyruvate/2-oxoglutarate dehydrogenase complex dihydrolipoamide dehydrogenase (E3) component